MGAWQNFYQIVGSAAGALTGLQFLVVVLIAQTRTSGSMAGIRAFATPTVIHFCSALLVAGFMSMPWPGALPLSICLVIGGLAGSGYSIRVIGHAQKTEYQPDPEDWVWYVALPLLGHLTLAVAGVLLWCALWWTPFLIASDALLFILLGVRNSWDTVTYLTLQHVQKKAEE